MTRPARYRLRHATLQGDVWVLHYVDPAITPGALALLETDLTDPSAAGLRESTTERGWTEDETAARAGSDMARMLFRDEAGRTVVRQIPGATGYLADGETVDPTEASIAAYIAAVMANTVASDGADIVQYVRGWRVTIPE